jgi:hypothetical protein
VEVVAVAQVLAVPAWLLSVILARNAVQAEQLPQ